jgi:hypothetical protein
MNRIVLTIHHHSRLSLDLTILNVGFIKTTVVAQHTIHLDEPEPSLEAGLQALLPKIHSLWNNKAFIKPVITVNLDMKEAFYEDINLPMLNSRSTHKALSIEMNSLYEDFEKRFISIIIKNGKQKKYNRFRIVMIQRTVYQKVLFFLRALQHPIHSINLLPISLYQALLKNKYIQKKSPSFFVNISDHSATVLVLDKALLSYATIPITNSKQDPSLSGFASMDISSLVSELCRPFYHIQNQYIEEITINIESPLERTPLGETLGYHMNRAFLVMDEDKIPDCRYLGAVGAILPGGKSTWALPKRIPKMRSPHRLSLYKKSSDDHEKK